MATESRAFVSHDDSDGASSQAIVLIDRSSRCVWHTVRAAQVIGFQCSCLEIGHRFCFTSRHVQAWLEHQLLQLDQGVSGARPSFATSDEVRSGTMLANHDSRRPIVLFARPTPSLDVGTSWPKALLSLQAVDLNQPPHLLGSVLQQVFGLTATETIVAQLLVDGLTPSAIATVRRIAISTVRAHLKSLYLKTRTRGQVELTRVLLQTSCV